MYNQTKDYKMNRIQLLERLADGVLEWDILNETIYLSNSLKDRLGYRDNEISNDLNKLIELIHPVDLEYVKNLFENYFRQNAIKIQLEYRIKTKSSDYRTFLVDVAIFYGSNNEPVYIIGMHKDITKKRMLENTIEKTEEYYRNIFNMSKAIMLTIDSKTIEIVDANEEACRFYGYSREQLVSMNAKEIEIMPQGHKRKEILKEFKKVENLGFGQAMLKHRLGNGDVKDVEVYISPIEIDGKIYFHCIIHDITKQLKIKKLFRDSERKYKKLFNSMSDGVFLVGLSKDGIPNKLLDVNKTACDDLGYTRDELLKLTLRDLESSEAYRETIKRISQLFKKKYSRFEVDIIKKDRGCVTVEFNTHLFKLNGQDVILAISRDITEQKIVQKTILENKEKYRTLIKSFPDAAFVHYNEIIEYANDKGAQLLGYNNSEEILGKSVWKFIPKSDIKRAISNISKAYDKKNNTSLMEQKLIKIDRSIIDVEMSSTIINYNGKNAIFSAMRDITKRKIIEEKLKKTMEQNKILLRKTVEHEKVKTDFFANISHELKTPLNIILGSIQLIQRYHDDHVKCTKYNLFSRYVKMMKQNCYRLLRLVNNLIDITKLDANYLKIEFKNYNIISVVEEITMSVAEYLKNKGINLVFDTEIEERILACDVDKIERILLNLLSNAIKYTDVGGSIFVNIYDRNDKILISVKDTGIGIQKERLQDIFKRFRQADSLMTRKKEGSGIGLSLVKSLVEAHGGNIKVRSEVGRGSEFIIEIPIRIIGHPYIKNEVASTIDEKVERINIEFSDIYS